MPKIKVALTVEFEVDSADPRTIDLALDQVILLQPSCKIVSKSVIEIDGVAVGGQDPLSSDFLGKEPPRESQNGGHGDSYRPDYAYQDDRDQQRIDRYRPGFSDGCSRAIDSYRPQFSTSARTRPDRQRVMNPSEKIDARITRPGLLGTRFDALIEELAGTANPQPKRNRRDRAREAHYSPPPRRDRSASPSSSIPPRRSDRLRSHITTANSNGTVCPAGQRERSRSRSRDSISDLRRKLCEYEESQEGRLEKWGWQRRRDDEDAKRRDVGGRSGSLEQLAPKIVAKGPTGERHKFERQQEQHGITEALRLKNLRSSQKIEKAKRISDRQRWGGDGEVKPGARIDAVISEIASFDFGAPSITANGHSRTGSEAATSHPPVETRKKKKNGGNKARGRSGAGDVAGPGGDDDEMQDVNQGQHRDQWQGQVPNSTSAAVAAAEAATMDMPVDDGGGAEARNGAYALLATAPSLVVNQ